MNKFKFLILLFLINVMFSILYLRASPVCYSYTKNSFNGIVDFSFLIISIPLFWILGFVVMLFSFKPLFFESFSRNIKNILENLVPLWLLCALLSVFSLTLLEKFSTLLNKKIYFFLISIFLNFASLESLSIAMGV
jgi:hypothetical protein